jgi:predicted ATPase/GGDEF domain-containing protein
VINSPAPTDDFARELTLEELASFMDGLVAERPVMLCSAMPDDLPALRADMDDARIDALLRELAQFVRRNLRGGDAIATVGEELVLVLDVPATTAAAVVARLLAAVRGHVFSGGAADRSLRLTLSLGVVVTGGDGAPLGELLPAAREARIAVESDGVSIAHAGSPQSLDLQRFVGRTEQLATFSEYLDDMVRGVGRVVGVLGERGVGASALVRSLEPEIRLRGGSLVVGSAHQRYLPAPYALWIAVLRAIRRLPVKSTRIWRELPALEPSLGTRSEESIRGGSKTRLLEELAEFLRLAAQQRPLVLLLEHLQWADAASWDALEYLLTQIESERILVVLTIQTDSRDDEVLSRWQPLAGRPRHHEMQLTRLTRDDVKRWLEGALRTGEAGRDLLAYLYRHTAGNPLLLVHMVRDLEESGHVVRRAGQWHWSPITSLPRYQSIDDLLARRISRLAKDARAIIDALAILGRDGDEVLLADITRMDVKIVQATFARLLASGLLVSSYDRERTTYVLAHAEIARVAGDLLDAASRKRLHADIADALARHREGATEIAGHYERADDGPNAHRFALIGADEALAVYERDTVAELLATAGRTAPTEADLAAVRVRMASVAEEGGRYEEAEALCEQALQWYSTQGDRLNALSLKRTRTLVRMKRGQGFRETLSELVALEAEAADAGADAERTAILLVIAQVNWRLGDVPQAQRVAEEAVATAERGNDLTLLADACNRLGTTLTLEKTARAREMLHRALEIATALGDPLRRLRVLNNIGVLEMLASNWDESERMLRMASDQARTAGLIENWGRAELNLGVLAARIGDYEGARRGLSEALRLTALVQNTVEQLYAIYNLAHLERETEHYPQAAHTYELVTELAERIGQVMVHAGATAGLGLSLLAIGDVAGARSALARAKPIMSQVPTWFEGRELCIALEIRIVLLDGAIEEASRLFVGAIELTSGDNNAMAWLTAEFGALLRSFIPAVIDQEARKYASLPEVLGNPSMRDRLAVLKTDS